MISIPLKQNPLHQTWLNMKDRCTNPNSAYYASYGGRGIKVCEAWSNSHTQFLIDMGARPISGFSIDRINNDMHYSCGSCSECVKNGWTRNLRWADNLVQTWNQRMRSTNTSGYRGVRRDRNGKWQARITLAKQTPFHIGTFNTPDEAALAFDKAVIFFRGHYGGTNYL